MPNQTNFVQLVPSSPKAFPISRIANSEGDTDILEGRLPGQFGFSLDDNIEMHFYDAANNLVGSVLVPVDTGIITGKTIILPDGTVDEKILIDMTRVQQELGLLVPPGNYTVSMNFFSNEIGNYVNPKMTIEEVSPSRTELRLGFVNAVTQTEQTELYEFTQPSVPRVIATGLVADTLGVNQQGTGIEIDEELEALVDRSRTEVEKFIDSVVRELVSANPTLIVQLADLQPEAPDYLNLTIEYLVGSIYEEFVSLLSLTKNTKQFDRLQEDELNVLLTQAVDNVLQDVNLNLFTQDTVRYEANINDDATATARASD
jgi:hypothetical protein